MRSEIGSSSNHTFARNPKTSLRRPPAARRSRNTGWWRAIAIALLTGALLAPTAMAAESRLPAGAVVNVNAATLEELQLLPGVGESRAQAILSMRKERGGFKSVSELGDVKGIGDALLARMKPHVRLSGKTTTP